MCWTMEFLLKKLIERRNKSNADNGYGILDAGADGLPAAAHQGSGTERLCTRTPGTAYHCSRKQFQAYRCLHVGLGPGFEDKAALPRPPPQAGPEQIIAAFHRAGTVA